MEGKPDITTIECDQVRFCKDVERNDTNERDVRLLEISPTNKRDDFTLKWLVSGENMQVYLLNNEGKTIDKIW